MSGEVRGVNKLAEKYFEKNKLDLTVYLPDWKLYGKSTGIIMNKDIVKNSDIAVAFWGGKSRVVLSSIKNNYLPQ